MSLEDKAIDFKGKSYILVKDRILEFNAMYPNGSITTELISKPDDEMVVIKATVVPDCDKPSRIFSDYSQAKWGEGYINKTSAMENCSTSAVGRALAMMGIGIIDSIASADEMVKAGQTPVKEHFKPAQETKQELNGILMYAQKLSEWVKAGKLSEDNIKAGILAKAGEGKKFADLTLEKAREVYLAIAKDIDTVTKYKDEFYVES